MKEIMESIANRLYHEVFNSSYINYGGCCWFAGQIAQKLEKYGIPYRMALIPSDDVETFMEEILEGIKDKRTTFGTSHVAIEVDDVIYDSQGVSSMIYAYDELFLISWDAHTIKQYYKFGSWNPTFRNDISNLDRKIIKNIIEDEFKGSFGY